MSNVLRLMYPVGPDREPDETDIVALKQGLARIGQYEAPNWQKAADYDSGLFKAVEDFQRSKGLKIDGLVKPRGPTAEAIAAELGPASPLVTEKDPRPVPGIRDPYRFPLGIDANARAANQRTVKALRHAGKYGLLPGLAATAWQKGDSGKAQVVDLFHQVGADDARAGTGHARNLEDRFLPMIPRDDRGLFRGLLGRKRDQVPFDGLAGGQKPVAIAQAGAATQPTRTPLYSGRRNPQDDARFARYRANLRPIEGGFVDDPRDPGGRTNKGIIQDTLTAYRQKRPGLNLPSDPKQLTDSQITEIYRDEFYYFPKIDLLANVPGLEIASPNLAAQIFDAGVLPRPILAGKWLQQSLDEALGTNLKTKLKDGSVGYDGNIGPATRAAVRRAVDEGKIAAVNNAVVDKRVKFFRAQPGFATYGKGWIARAESYRQ